MRATVLYSSVLPSFGGKEPAVAVRIAQIWLALGCFAVLFLPALRGRSEWIGWLPLWLVIVPAAQLAFLRWRSLSTATRKAWRHFSHRRTGSAPRHVRRVRKTARPRRVGQHADVLLAALLPR